MRQSIDRAIIELKRSYFSMCSALADMVAEDLRKANTLPKDLTSESMQTRLRVAHTIASTVDDYMADIQSFVDKEFAYVVAGLILERVGEFFLSIFFVIFFCTADFPVCLLFCVCVVLLCNSGHVWCSLVDSEARQDHDEGGTGTSEGPHGHSGQVF